jgi:DNA-binding NarL/FixJ family response regulator
VYLYGIGTALPVQAGTMLAGATITIAIIDDNLMVCHALQALLGTLPDLNVVFAGDSAAGAITDTNPDVFLLDAGLADGNSQRVALELHAAYPDSRIVVMDLLPTSDDVREFVNAGVAGFALKDSTLEELADTIRAVATGLSVLPTRMTESLFSQIAREAGAERHQEVIEGVRMTPRELQILEVIGEGLSNKEIAVRLNIATHTVKSHLRNVMEKLALHSRLQVAAYTHRKQ